MAGFILCRKSRDEDEEHESLHIQRDLVREYVHKVGDTIIDEVLENNISGTLFDRPGIKPLLIVKDMKERNVRIVSVTEGIDSFNRSDDLIIGFKGLINDSYVQDIIVKILSALRHKQQFEGIVINVPMGYLKDRYTKKVEICEETADIIRRIYKLFLDGHGTETIAKILNQEGVKTLAYYELKLKEKSLGDNKPKATFEYLWTYSIVRRILTNPFYCGDLVNHQRVRSRITKKQIKVPKEEQFIHTAHCRYHFFERTNLTTGRMIFMKVNRRRNITLTVRLTEEEKAHIVYHIFKNMSNHIYEKCLQDNSHKHSKWWCA